MRYEGEVDLRGCFGMAPRPSTAVVAMIWRGQVERTWARGWIRTVRRAAESLASAAEATAAFSLAGPGQGEPASSSTSAQLREDLDRASAKNPAPGLHLTRDRVAGIVC